MFAWWVVLMLVGYHIAAAVADVKMLFYYEHPGDSRYSQGLLAKVHVLICLQFAWHMLTGLPTDVYDAAFKASFDMSDFWELTYIGVAVFLSFPLPFAAFFYEADSDPRITKTPAWRKGLCYAIIACVIVWTTFGVSYAILKDSNEFEYDPAIECQPVDSLMCGRITPLPADGYPLHPFCLWEEEHCRTPSDDPRDRNLRVCHNNFLSICIYTLVFVGWFPFSFLASTGLVALPLDLIVGFIDRPKPIDARVYNERKSLLATRASGLRTAGNDLKQREVESRLLTGIGGRRAKLSISNELKKFRQSAFLLEEEYRNLNISMKERGENPALSYAKLVIGIISALVSMIWTVQMFLCILIPPLDGGPLPGMLNDVLCYFGQFRTYFVDLMIYGFFNTYLLVCVLKGSFKFGMRFFFCCAIHPMRKEDTHLGSFLFNVTLVLLSAAAIPHFSTMAFYIYANGTTADRMFLKVLPNVKLIGSIFEIHLFVWFMVVWSVITLIYLLVRPRDKVSFPFQTDFVQEKEIFARTQQQSE